MLAVLFVALLTFQAAGHALGAENDGSYESALAMAHNARTAKELDDAARVLSATLLRYPQDVDLPLQLGWVQFRSGRFSDALYSYTLAFARTGQAGEAELGMAWSLLKLGRCAEARAHFQPLSQVGLLHPDLLEAVKLCEAERSHAAAPPPKLWIAPTAMMGVYLYQNNPYIKYTLAPFARLDALVLGRFYFAAAYRYSFFKSNSTQLANWSQNDLYLSAGITGKRLGATLHYALLLDGSGYSGTSHHIGLSARYSFDWDVLLHLSASFYKDAPVLRGELDFRVPVFGGFSMLPGAALQWTPGEVSKALRLSALYDFRRASVWIGGKVGDEERAAYLNVSYVYNGTYHIPYGAWAGAVLRAGAGFAISLSGTYDDMLNTAVTPVQQSSVYSLTLGLSKEF